MNENESDMVSSTSDTVPANKISVLRPGEAPSDVDSLTVADGESAGFDPYDTASLFVQKSADPS